ncbi:hypothetical protein Efla_004130 [Eimeria flavescens]
MGAPGRVPPCYVGSSRLPPCLGLIELECLNTSRGGAEAVSLKTPWGREQEYASSFSQSSRSSYHSPYCSSSLLLFLRREAAPQLETQVETGSRSGNGSMIYYLLVLGKTGVIRLSRWYVNLTDEEKAAVLLELKQQVLLPHGGPSSAAAAEAAADPQLQQQQQQQRARVLMLPPLPVASCRRSVYRVVYRQLGALLYIAAADGEESTLVIGELLELFADLLRQLLGAPSSSPLGEAQLAMQMDSALLLLDCMIQHGYVLCTDKEALLSRTKEFMRLD